MVAVDYSQAYFLNRYLEAGDDVFLYKALEDWLVVQARKNREYYQKNGKTFLLTIKP